MSYECRELAAYYFMSQAEHYFAFLFIGGIAGYLIGRFQSILWAIYKTMKHKAN